MKPEASLDFETRSGADLKRTGAWRYATDRSTLVLCLGWKVGTMERMWRTLEEDLPADLVSLARRAARGEIVFTAWNAMFEWCIWNLHLVRRFPALPALPFSAWSCTAAEALVQGWPGKLEMAADAMGIEGKDPRGRTLTQRCGNTRFRLRRDELDGLYEYCAQDVRVESHIRARLTRREGGWAARERHIQELDHRINTRGIRVDLDAARAIQRTIEHATQTINDTLPALTGGAVTRATQAARIKAWAEERGVRLPNMQAETVERVLSDGRVLPDDVRAVLQAREVAGGSAIKKLRPMLEVPDPVDWRARGLLQYHGAAATGRWAGRLIQPQNFPRPVMKVKGDDLIAAFIDGTAEERFGVQIFTAASDALRPLFTATPGKRLVRADLSAIEARVVLWLAGHDDAMAVFRTGACIYCEQATAVYGRPIVKGVDALERQVGKVIVLGCGYQMGPDRFQEHAASNGITVTSAEAEEYVGAYRTRWWRVPKLWYGLGAACLEAARTGRRTSFRGVDFALHKGAMLCRIPSGRVLTWQAAELAEGRFGDEQVRVRRVKEGRWETVDLYGGILAERVTQALSRDIMADGMLRAEAEGLDIVLTVHDEIVSDTDVPDAEAKLVQCLTVPPPWAPDLPLAAEAEADFRYGK